MQVDDLHLYNVTVPQVFFEHFASKYQLPGFYISGTLVENRLKRLVHACRYVDMAPLFGRVLPQLSMKFDQTMDFIDTNWGHRLQIFNQG